MAIEKDVTCPVHMRARGFFILTPKSIPTRHFSLGNGVVTAVGDCLMDDGNGGLALGTDGGLTDLTFTGISMEVETGVTADNTQVAVAMVGSNDLMWVPVEAGTIAATSVGEVFDLQSEDGIDQGDTGFGTRGIGFRVIAVDTTNDMALGHFIRGAS